MSDMRVPPVSVPTDQADHAAPAPDGTPHASRTRRFALLPGDSKQREVMVLSGTAATFVDPLLSLAYLDALPLRERAADERKVALLAPEASRLGAVAGWHGQATRTRSGGQAIKPAVLDNWTKDIAFLSSGDDEAVVRGISSLMRSDNKLRSDDPGSYLTSLRDDAFVARAYGQELVATLGIDLDSVLGESGSGAVFLPDIADTKLRALIAATGALVGKMLEPSESISVSSRAGGSYLGAVRVYAGMIAARNDAPAAARNKAITTLYVNSLFLRGASAALQELAHADRRVAIVAGFVQSFANGATTPHRQVTSGSALVEFRAQRDAVQAALHKELVNLGAPFVAIDAGVDRD